MTAIPTARARARAELTSEIKGEASRQLAAGGAPSLSLRSVARRLGMASSAIYRYFPSRDELLTALIVDAYDDLGRAAERADAGHRTDDPAGRWLAVGRAVRLWALSHPHEYALLYGSPVPGYEAPERTVGPGTRVTLVLFGILGTVARHSTPGPRAAQASDASATPALTATLAADLGRLAEQFEPGVPPALLARGLVAWTQMFGMISFELFGQLHGLTAENDALFDVAAVAMAGLVGLGGPSAAASRQASPATPPAG